MRKMHSQGEQKKKDKAEDDGTNKQQLLANIIQTKISRA